MKKTVSIMLAILLVISLCSGCSRREEPQTDPAPVPPEQGSDVLPDTGGDGTETDIPEGPDWSGWDITEQTSTSETARGRYLVISTITSDITAFDGEENSIILIKAQYPVMTAVHGSPDSYEKLAAFYSNDHREQADSFIAENCMDLIGFAVSSADNGESFTPVTYSETCEIIREDEKVFSVLTVRTIGSGSGETDTIITGENYDAANCTRITLEDVVSDLGKLYGLMAFELRSDPGLELTMDEYDLTLSLNANMGDIPFTVGTDGLNFYISPEYLGMQEGTTVTLSLKSAALEDIMDPRYR
ncbi:MAG: hypothetical protein IK026_03745 [Eubacteriaceae bacterium]|nr:hypothetical protein [Eubacteriaceae bacterium]